jgi:diaminopimelate decarboxylase
VRTYVAVDGGMSDNIRPALYGSHYTLRPASRAPSSPGRIVTIVGRHCESGDVLARDVQVPEDLARGDLVAFASPGARPSTTSPASTSTDVLRRGRLPFPT